MEIRQAPQHLIAFAINLARCNNSVRGRREAKKIYRQIAAWCAQQIDDKRVKK